MVEIHFVEFQNSKSIPFPVYLTSQLRLILLKFFQHTAKPWQSFLIATDIRSFIFFCNCNHKQSILFRAVGTCPNLFWRKCKKKNVQVILFERDYPIFNTNLHELFCKLKIYDDLIIINLYSSFSI